MARAFALSAGFFARPQAAKDALAWTSARSNRGYVVQGREKVTNLTDAADVEALRAQNPDLKESFEIGREGEPGLPNHWPPAGEGDADAEVFAAFMQGFFGTCAKLHAEVMRAVALGLGIDVAWFDEYTDGEDNTLRLLHYPQVDKDVFKRNKGQVRAGSHTDYGSISECVVLCCMAGRSADVD